MSEARTELHLGRGQGADVRLPDSALLRHVMALGSSGSGKTVLCKVVVEEAVRRGIPVICVDPQGDLCSLALAAGQAPGGGEAEDGHDPAEVAAFGDRADVVVFTPASRVGVPLCADPLAATVTARGVGAGVADDGASGVGAPADDAADDASTADRVRARSRAADMIAALLGYDADSDDGDGLRAVLDTALAELDARGTPARRLEELSAHFASPGAEALARYERYLDARRLRAAARRLARLDVGARRLLFHDGLPIDIDALLGRGPRGGGVPGKTRVAVIYLNTLHSQDDKEFFVAALVDRLYGWMLANPSAAPQALFYIDEIAPFLPPVRKPACKPGLSLLFKQARKYGVSCLMATQNPGDVDYKAMSQFGTWALGRLTTRQDIAKIAPIVKSLAPERADEILASLPARRPGEFALLSPDCFAAPVTLFARRLLTAHETLDERRIEELADARWRDRFPVEAPATDDDAGVAADAGIAESDAELDRDEADTVDDEADASEDEVGAGEHDAGAGEDDAGASEDDAGAGEDDTGAGEDDTGAGEDDADAASGAGPGGRDAAPAVRLTDTSRPSGAPAPPPSPRDDARERMARALGKRRSMTARELAAVTGSGESTARRVLKELVAHGVARGYKDGRAMRYFSVHTGARPDLGLGSTVAVVEAEIDRAAVDELARGMQKSRLLGLLGDDEAFETAQLVYRPVYQVVFEEKVKRFVLQRLFGASHDNIIGTTYHHPRTLQVLVYTPRRGIAFVDDAGQLASGVEDFDGVARFADVAPGTLEIDDEAWRRRRRPVEVRKHFRARFEAEPREIAPVFVPLWRLIFRQHDRGNYRVVLIDALVGKPVDWP